MGAWGVPGAPFEEAVALRAASVSDAIAALLARPAISGVVVAVHRTAVNVELAGQSVTILPADAGRVPDGVTLVGGFLPRAAGIRPGMTVRSDGRAIRIGDLVPPRLVVDLTAAVAWSPRPAPIPIAAPGLAARVAALRASLPPSPLAGAPGAAVAPAAGTATPGALFRTAPACIRHLEEALDDRSGSATVAAEAGMALVGMGPGLTPSGDDLLVGVSAALTMLGDGRARPLAGAWARAAAGRTTPVAATFHAHAAAGAYAERLHDVLRAVLAGPIEAIPAAVARAAAWGATSGADTLLGVAIALSATVGRTEVLAA